MAGNGESLVKNEEENYVLYCIVCGVGARCRMVEWVAEGHDCRKFCLIRGCLARFVSEEADFSSFLFISKE
jgi:hypothetical protein